ncbi:MAG: site-specific integrase [Acidobacteriaceae bacterium]
MRVFKKSKFYHYEFEFERKRYQGSTRRKNEREAIQIASALQFRIVKQSVGLGPKEPAPTIRDFQSVFENWIDQEIEDSRTREFYKVCYRRLTECEYLADVRLDQLNEPLIEKFKTWSLGLEAVKSKTTVNRYLATLSKALHYASDKLKLIDSVPKIHKFPKSKVCEREREFVFSMEQYEKWIATAPEPLRSSSIMARACGMSRNELLALQKDAVHITTSADPRGFYGYIEIKRGLKRESRKRKLPITIAMRDVIVSAIAGSNCKHVFTSSEARTKPMSPNTLADQVRRTQEELQLPKGVGLHALRHSFLTQAGKLTQNVKALQLLAGHSNVQTTMRYIHPNEADVFAIVADSQSAQGNAVGDAPVLLKHSVPSKTPSTKLAARKVIASI